MKSKNTKRGKKKNNNNNMSNGVTQSSRVPRNNYLATTTGGVAQQLRRTLVYATAGTAGATASIYTEPGVIILNNPYLPCNGLAAGLAADGFAKYMAMYSKCFTVGARVKIKAAALSTAAGYIYDDPIAFGITVTTNSTAIANVSLAVSNGLCDYHVGNNSPDRYQASLGIDIGKYMHVPSVLSNSQLFCTASAAPGQIVCAHWWTYGFTTTTVSLAYILEVEFDVVFTDPIPFT